MSNVLTKEDSLAMGRGRLPLLVCGSVCVRVCLQHGVQVRSGNRTASAMVGDEELPGGRSPGSALRPPRALQAVQPSGLSYTFLRNSREAQFTDDSFGRCTTLRGKESLSWIHFYSSKSSCAPACAVVLCHAP